MAGDRDAPWIAFGRGEDGAFDRLGVKQQRLAGLAQPPLAAQRLEQRRTHRLTEAGQTPADGRDVDLRASRAAGAIRCARATARNIRKSSQFRITPTAKMQ